MAETHPTKVCLHCQQTFIPKMFDKARAKYCSLDCRRAARKAAVGSGSQIQTTCQNCGQTLYYWPSQGERKYCNRQCKHDHWKQPSAQRGFQDLTGQMFGRLLVLEYAGINPGHHHAWKVRCSCAAQTEFIVNGHSMKAGRTQSCGCRVKGVDVPKPDTKKCKKCGKMLPYTADHFIAGKRFRWGLRPCCHTCWAPIRRKRHLIWRRKLKLEVLSHYSNGQPSCSCCGVSHVEFLTLDHVNNDGSADRHVRGAGTNFYALLKREGYPHDPPLTVLCFNCNIARALFGCCPHKSVT